MCSSLIDEKNTFGYFSVGISVYNGIIIESLIQLPCRNRKLKNLTKANAPEKHIGDPDPT